MHAFNFASPRCVVNPIVLDDLQPYIVTYLRIQVKRTSDKKHVRYCEEAR